MKIHKKLQRTLAFATVACLLGVGAAWVEPAAFGASVAYAYPLQEETNVGIIGLWEEESAPKARLLAIHKDSTYELMDKNGDGIYYGRVEVTFEEHPDGSQTPWYSFYKGDGTLWMGFPKNEAVEVQTELLSGHDGSTYFLRKLGNEFVDTSEGVVADSYLGVWGCGRSTISISKEDRGYLVNIQWASSASEGTRWTYHCAYDDYSAVLVSNNNGICEDYSYTESGKESITQRYSDGTAIFVMREGVLTWQDEKENAGDSIAFLK